MFIHTLLLNLVLTARYSKRAKALLLETYHLSPVPTVVELDTRTDGLLIQTILTRLTGRSTVPNIILKVRFETISYSLYLTRTTLG